jgi:GDPmannose 4,6-dehydratase
MIALIFGANGQDGIYLTDLFRDKNIDVIRISRSDGDVIGSITNYSLVAKLVKKYKPFYIINLAANSSTQHDVIFNNHETISTGSLNILEATRVFSPNSKVFITGSGLQFKNIGFPLSEYDSFEASSAYATSRIHSTFAARYYRSLGIKVYVGYLFHHESPYRRESYISKKITEAAKNISRGNNQILEIQDISVEKEWGYAKDIMRGVITLLEQEHIFEATIGTGITYTIENWIESCFSLVGLDWKDHVVSMPNYNSQYKKLVSNPKTINQLGWRPEINFNDLASLMMN